MYVQNARVFFNSVWGSLLTVLACIFSNDVPCLYRESDKVKFMTTCLNCPPYSKFMREMDEEDAKVMEEIDQIHKFGYPKSFRELKEGAV